jgi:prevent-host-death family protein
MVMNTVGIAELKARLSEKINEVRRGETITVLDRKTPVALIVPVRAGSEPLRVRRAAGKRKPGSIPLPPRTRAKQDVVDLLLEDRSRR